MNLERKIIKILSEKKRTVSVAESCTGGLVSERLTSVSGASKVFEFGVVVYSGQAKKKLLKIKPAVIEKYGEVSREVASAMAIAVQKISKSDYALAVTGIAGPTGGTASKPVGTLCFSLLSPQGRLIRKKLLLQGGRNEIRWKASTVILNMLYQDIQKKEQAGG